MFGFGKKKKEAEEELNNSIPDESTEMFANGGSDDIPAQDMNYQDIEQETDSYVGQDNTNIWNADEQMSYNQEGVLDKNTDTEANADADIDTVTDETADAPEEAEEKKGFFSRLMQGLTKSRNSFSESFANLFKANEIDDDFYDDLEETLVMADLGVETTDRIIEDLKARVKEDKIKEVEVCKQLIVNIIRDQMEVDESAYDFEDKKTVVLVIGVNGVGKTTSIGKLAAQYKSRGKKVLMAAADTFRAAAIDQLKTWANRAGVDIIAQGEGADPSAVVYDAVSAAKSRNADILLIDTAGRLHNKKNLMDELAKMRRVISREYPEANVESLIVLDGTTGQNALEQARQFSNVTEINGIIITKLDGTAKGGIAIAIQSELNVPVKYIGIGEKIEDLQRFDPNAYVNALFADFDTRSDIEILVDSNIEKIKKDDDLFDV